MPYYEFKCQDCNSIFELYYQRPRPSIKCPNCEGQALKQFTPTPVQFKGEGFTKSK